MVWKPPTPAPGLTGEDVANAAAELGGAAYRVQKQSWAPQQDAGVPYWKGFVLATQELGVSTNVGTNNPTGLAGTARPRAGGSKQVGGEGGPTSHRKQKLVGNETTGEDTGPIFNNESVKQQRS